MIQGVSWYGNDLHSTSEHLDLITVAHDQVQTWNRRLCRPYHSDVVLLLELINTADMVMMMMGD
ncbi:hypothetical protein D3C75_996210 [compost metagenome]